MKAAQINGYGTQEVLVTVSSATKPSARPGQVLVEAHAAGVNPFDWKIREGYLKDYIPLKFPATLGGDIAGIVSETGEGVSGFEVGQAVYGLANATSSQGSFAEFTPVKAEQLAAKPDKADFITAGALPLVAVSAYQALVDYIKLNSGQKILIHGGSGGIGSVAIQLAKHMGAYVATTASTSELDYVKELGADEVIDYKNQDFSDLLKNYDAVFDNIGGEVNVKSYKVLKPGGTFVSMVDQPNAESVKTLNINYVHQQSQASTEKLNKIAELFDQGIIKIHIDKVFPLDQAAEALEYLKTGHPRGKVVLSIK